MKPEKLFKHGPEWEWFSDGVCIVTLAGNKWSMVDLGECGFEAFQNGHHLTEGTIDHCLAHIRSKICDYAAELVRATGLSYCRLGSIHQ